ncbi:hypothetical protein NYF95_002432 [Salmonella enterica]|nr:hypothetical protein [Salmonella enterica]EJQ9383919.1 hypothetical protein [Salmonella enterica]
MEKLKLLLVIVALCGVFFIIGLYAGGWVWLTLSGVPSPSLSMMTLINQGGIPSLTDQARMLLPWAWCVTAAITFFPAGVSLIAMTKGADGNRKDLHGNARFANRRELRRLWYTGPEQEDRS